MRNNEDLSPDFYQWLLEEQQVVHTDFISKVMHDLAVEAWKAAMKRDFVTVRIDHMLTQDSIIDAVNSEVLEERTISNMLYQLSKTLKNHVLLIRMEDHETHSIKLSMELNVKKGLKDE